MKTINKLIVIIALLSIQLNATGQSSDIIIINGDTCSLFTNPLNYYFEKYPDKIPEPEISNSSLWRGYIATFEIKKNGLYLIDLEMERMLIDSAETGDFDTEWFSAMDSVFPGQKEVLIDCFSGLLIMPKGKYVKYVHLGYASEYENYTLISVESGVVKKSKDFNHTEYVDFKNRQFEEFKKTNQYKEAFEEVSENKKYDDEFVENFIKEAFNNYPVEILLDF